MYIVSIDSALNTFCHQGICRQTLPRQKRSCGASRTNWKWAKRTAVSFCRCQIHWAKLKKWKGHGKTFGFSTCLKFKAGNVFPCFFDLIDRCAQLLGEIFGSAIASLVDLKPVLDSTNHHICFHEIRITFHKFIKYIKVPVTFHEISHNLQPFWACFYYAR